jgi:NhaP-type Na+/H+ or K+/H+ antiporter
LAIVKESEFPTLNSILFGEGVVNDAVAILIFKSVEQMIEAGQDDVNPDIIDTRGVNIGAKEIGKTVLDFFVLTISSLALGISIGLISAFILKHVKSLHHHPVLEIFLILLFGYSSYLFAELFNLSGIMCLFFCGVTMSHYTYHNVSQESKLGSVITISTMSFAAEAFLFTYLGMSIFSTESSTFSLTFTFLIILAAVISRFASVFISIAIYALFKRCVIEIDCKQLMLIWFSGLIRGAIAFALSLEISDKIAPHRDQMVSTTLMMVLMTTVVLGGFMSAFAKLIGLDAESADEEEDIGTHDAQIERFSDVIFKDKKRSWLQTKFHMLDDKILKPCFGGDLTKRAKHKEERKIELERKTIYLKIQAMKKQKRQTEVAVNSSLSKDPLLDASDMKGNNRGTHLDDKSNLYMNNTQLDMIAEDEEDD